jgi:hypothetical protein
MQVLPYLLPIHNEPFPVLLKYLDFQLFQQPEHVGVALGDPSGTYLYSTL